MISSAFILIKKKEMKQVLFAILIFIASSSQVYSAEKCNTIEEKLYSMAEADVKITSERDELKLGDLSLENKLNDVRRQNSLSLKKILKSCGWPIEKKYGEAAAAAAWLVVQHADEDPEFQNDVLKILSPLVKKGEESPVRYAYLQDRTQLKRNGKQIYGTQLFVTSESVSLPPHEIDSIEAVNKRRAQIGLESIQDYIARVKVKRAQSDSNDKKK